MPRRVRFDEGLYIAVTADGYVCNGAVNGAKLYVNEGVAARKAGPGGSVYRVRMTAIGPLVQRTGGPAVSLLQLSMQGEKK